MDLLDQYKKQHGEQAPAQTNIPIPSGRDWRGGEEHSSFVRLVMRASGGRITDDHQANIILLIMGGIFFAVSIFLFARAFTSPTSAPVPKGEGAPPGANEL